MKKTEILGYQNTNGPEAVFAMNYGYAIIDDIKPNHRGSLTVWGRSIYTNLDRDNNLTAYISEKTSTWTLNQVERAYAENLNNFIELIEEKHAQHRKQEQEKAKRAEAARTAQLGMEAIFDRLGFTWYDAHFQTYYHGKCTIEFTADALLTLIAHINDHTQEVTA